MSNYDGVKITYEYTAKSGEQIKGSEVRDWGLSIALELFADLSVDRLPKADLSKPYKLTIIGIVDDGTYDF